MTASRTPELAAAVHTHEFRAMGSRAYIVVHGGTTEMLARAVDRVRDLEAWWSRFQVDSDVTRANQAAGRPVVVHADTLAVVARAMEAWRQTNGRFDITTLPALISHGYTHSAVNCEPAPLITGTRVGTSALIGVDYLASTITVPARSAIDLGGIGKGFAADIVAEDLIEAGALGALVNIGGDLVVLGRPSDDESWYLGIEDPRDPSSHIARLRLDCGAIATSGTTIRRWVRPDGSHAHHLIDPCRAQPSDSGIVTATVIAADAATAEVYATALTLMAGIDGVALLAAVQLAGIAVDDSGAVFTTSTLKDFLV